MKKFIIMILMVGPFLVHVMRSMENKQNKEESIAVEEPLNNQAIVIDAVTVPIKQKFGLTTKRQFYAEPSKIVFELWNKKKTPFYFRISEEENWPAFDPSKVYWLPANHIIALTHDQIDISKRHYIYFYGVTKGLKSAYRIEPGKTIFVRIKENKKKEDIFGPQTGPLKGFSGLSKLTRDLTDTGLSKADNVSQQDINLITYGGKLTGRRDRQRTPDTLNPENMNRELALVFIGLPTWAGKPEILAQIEYYEERQKEKEGTIDPTVSAYFNEMINAVRKNLLDD